MITLTDVKAAVRAFETTKHIPLSNAWDAVRHTMHVAIQDYAKQEGLTVAAVATLVDAS
jgi:hypothetical protein